MLQFEDFTNPINVGGKIHQPGINFDEALKGGRIIVCVLVVRELCDVSQQNITGHQLHLPCQSPQLKATKHSKNNTRN